MNKEWLKAAGIRAIKTMGQSAVGMMALGMSATEIDWLNVISVAVVAGVMSVLTSLEGLPEVTTEVVVAEAKTSDTEE